MAISALVSLLCLLGKIYLNPVVHYSVIERNCKVFLFQDKIVSRHIIVDLFQKKKINK